MSGVSRSHILASMLMGMLAPAHRAIIVDARAVEQEARFRQNAQMPVALPSFGFGGFSSGRGGYLQRPRGSVARDKRAARKVRNVRARGAK